MPANFAPRVKQTLMLGTLDDSIKFFKGVAELIEAARGRMLVALASCAEAP
jgi:hypothetical protein